MFDEKKTPFFLVFSRRPFLAHSGGGQETTFYLRVASVQMYQSRLARINM